MFRIFNNSLSRRAALLLVFAVSIISILVLFDKFHSSQRAREFNPIQAEQAYRDLRSRLNTAAPGRGVADYGDFPIADIPKSYAMIVIAELERKEHHPEHPLELAIRSGQWLLDHFDENKDGIPGWGIPISWDAYGDGSVNPANTEYCISTAIVVRALLDWMEVDASAPQSRIKDTVSAVLSRWSDPAIRSQSGLLPYSLMESDRRYDTFNPASYLAGQMQRYSAIAPPQLANRLRSASDASMQVLLDQKRIDANGDWYWMYSIQENIPNDLAHAVYIMDGISSYVNHGGRLGDQFNMQRVTSHLRMFLRNDDSFISGFPIFRNIVHPARSYDIGIGLWFASRDQNLANTVAPQLAHHIPDYLRFDGLYKKYPKAGDQKEDTLEVNEYQASILCGLAAWSNHAKQYSLADQTTERAFEIPPELRHRALELNQPTSLSSAVEIPFSSLESKSKPAKLFINIASKMAHITLANGRILYFEQQGIPVRILDLNNGGLWVIFRSFPENHLKIFEFQNNNTTASYSFSLGDQDDGYLFFRAATVATNNIYIVLYDNRTHKNTIRRYSIDRDNLFSEITLPSLEDPAGGNYEMEPPIFLVPATNGELRILGGTLDAILSGSNLAIKRQRDCTRILEVASNSHGIATLCELRSNRSHAIFRLIQPNGVTLNFSPGDGIPWALTWSTENNSFQWELARTPQELGKMFEFDLKRGQNSGLLELGSNNIEGRIAWSQIYYLNGFLDLLNLAASDQQAYDAFGHLIQDIRKRLDAELALLDAILSSPLYYQTRAFTVRREPSLFAVQTSRLLVLLDRQANELPGATPSRNFERVRDDVYNLHGHIEELASSGENPRWIPKGRYHLRWPRGCAFPFDGLAVPYNHENEWAWSLFETAPRIKAWDTGPLLAARDIIKTFNEHILVPLGGAFPLDAHWRYWWGQAYEGWSATDGVSINTPSYSGDHGLAWISFRTIDVMAVISAIPYVPDLNPTAVLDSASSLLHHGDIYPFAATALLRHNRYPLYAPEVAFRYSRSGSPSDIANSIWAIARSMEKEVPSER